MKRNKIKVPDNAVLVAGFRGYKIDEDGIIYSYRRRNSPIKNRPQKIMKPYINKSGYCGITLRRGGGDVMILVHRLVLESFVGQCPKGMECCHYNGIRDDNRLENLVVTVTALPNHT